VGRRLGIDKKPGAAVNKFLAMTVFARVVEGRSFSTAARKLGMSVSAVTKLIAALEDEVGTQLLNRTTRQVAVTEYGQKFYERSVKILAEVEDAESSLRADNASPRGRIRAVVPLSFGRITLVPQLPAFFIRYPELTLDLSFSDRAVDLVAEGYDVAVRTGKNADSTLIARQLLYSEQVTVAAPSYLARSGTPQKPADLNRHNCLVGRFGPDWAFVERDGREITVRVAGNLIVHSGDALREAAVAGLGIAQGTHWLMRKDLKAGTVKQILSAYAAPGAPICALYPANRHLPAKVRAFVDFLVEITGR
jgi:DNA-binding transcriptional LysR family regulator